jgi:hypothetical protein
VKMLMCVFFLGVYLCTCFFVCMCVPIHMCVFVCVCVRVNTRLWLHAYVCMCVREYVRVCVCVSLSLYMSVFNQVHTYTRQIHVCMYVCMYVYTKTCLLPSHVHLTSRVKTCMRMYVYMHMYLYVHEYAYICIFMYMKRIQGSTKFMHTRLLHGYVKARAQACARTQPYTRLWRGCHRIFMP